MKLNELFESTTNSPEQLNELFDNPYGAGSKLKDKVKGSLKGIFGGGQGEAGNQVSGELANKMFKDFKHYVGTQGQANEKYIEKRILTDYLRGRGLDSNLANDLNDQITPKEAAEVMLKAAQSKRQLGQKASFDQGPSQSAELKQQPHSNTSTIKPGSSYDDILSALQSLTSKEKTDLINLLRLAGGKR